MCHYCGCRHIELIRDYIAEHERVMQHADLALRALETDELASAREHVRAMADELRAHWQGEENGVFVVLAAREERFADYIAPLVQEHRELDELLTRWESELAAGRLELADRDQLRTAVDELRAHIEREEDGLFPATLVTLSGAEWEAAKAAWHAAHPGRELIAD